jgi:cytochrome b561
MQSQGYSTTAVILHWLIAASIFFLFVSSWWMMGLPLPSKELTFRELPFQLHKNIGITLVIVLTILLYVRFKHRPTPPSAQELRPWMYKLAIIDHVILYVLIVAVCLSGYLSSSFTRWETTLWWLVDLPQWGRADEEMNMFFSDIHLWTAWALLGVVAVHISGALYHAFRNDGVVRRMLRL